MVWAYIVGVVWIAATFIWDTWFDVNYELAANISLIYFAAITTVFGVLYGFRSRWRANRVGRIFFVKALLLPLVLWQVVLSVWWDADYPGRQHIRFAIYSLAVVAYVVMVIVLVQQQRGDRRRRDQELRDMEHDAPQT